MLQVYFTTKSNEENRHLKLPQYNYTSFFSNTLKNGINSNLIFLKTVNMILFNTSITIKLVTMILTYTTKPERFIQIKYSHFLHSYSQKCTQKFIIITDNGDVEKKN